MRSHPSLKPWRAQVFSLDLQGTVPRLCCSHNVACLQINSNKDGSNLRLITKKN